VALPSVVEDGQPPDREVETDGFRPDGRWAEQARLWDDLNPERIIANRQLWEHAFQWIQQLPPNQQAVILLRDTEGRTSEEVCELLSISAENQRVLLHRARTCIRKKVDHLMHQPRAATAPMARPSHIAKLYTACSFTHAT